MIKTLIILLLMSFLILPSSASAMECTEKEAYAAEVVISYLDSWKEVYGAFKQFGHCDDGAIAEGFDDVISLLWAKQWDKLPEMIKYFKKDADFKNFVSNRIGTETIPYDRWETIVSYAKHRCPKEAKDFCKAVLKTK